MARDPSLFRKAKNVLVTGGTFSGETRVKNKYYVDLDSLDEGVVQGISNTVLDSLLDRVDRRVDSLDEDVVKGMLNAALDRILDWVDRRVALFASTRVESAPVDRSTAAEHLDVGKHAKTPLPDDDVDMVDASDLMDVD